VSPFGASPPQTTVTILAPPPPQAAPVGPPTERLSPEQQQEWAACVQQLLAIGLADADAERIVARAFGWGTQVRIGWAGCWGGMQ
jgi:hypothetical protein